MVDPFHNRKMVPGQLIWLVRKGDLIRPGEPITKTFGLKCRMDDKQYTEGHTIRETFVSTDLDDPPDAVAEFPETYRKSELFLRTR